jgi:uncharacterized protein (DUF885 family)
MQTTKRSVMSLTVLALLAVLVGCDRREPAAAPAPVTEDAGFQRLADRYVDESTRFSPIDATRAGDHRRDQDIDDLSPAGIQAQLAWDQELLAALGKIDRTRISRANQVDAAMLASSLRGDIWSLTQFRRREWDPLLYNELAGGAIYNLMAREYAPLADRLKAASARLAKVGTLYEVARANLDVARVPPIYAEQAKSRNPGVLSLIDEFIKPNVDKLDGADRAALEAAIAQAQRAVAEQQRWIEGTLLPNARGDFRVGEKLFDAELAFALLSPLDRAEIRRRAEAELKRVREEMYGVARQVLAGRPGAPALPEQPTPEEQQKAIAAALELAAAERPPRDKVVDFARDSLQRATEFVRARNLVSVPDDPIDIIIMPEFQRGFSVAYCDPPGPLDVGQKTFFAISPIPDDWDQKKVESFLREYNTRGIQDLTFHEAMPGHYLQLAASNRYPSKLRSLLGSGSFVEGWGVYAERVMTDAGYLDNDPLMKLVNRKWYLRGIANALIDQAIHVDGMTRAQAMRLMTHDTFQEEREAAGKWVRAEISSTQLSTYFVGFQEHWDLRQEAERRAGASFNLKEYHDRVISYGSPPVRLVRALMFDLPIEP